MGTLVIYYNEEKTISQVIKPSLQFDGNWQELVWALAGKHGYHSFKVLN